MSEHFIALAGLGIFFLAFGVYNWFHPFIAATGLKLRVDPQRLDVVRRTMGRMVAVAMSVIGLGLLVIAFGG
ncbi:MAG: hypothetical protein U5R14_08045 [Gemmatimonadota bacterium]|nr:hypothetical protein [Gemmatimonadota bacterium]